MMQLTPGNDIRNAASETLKRADHLMGVGETERSVVDDATRTKMFLIHSSRTSPFVLLLSLKVGATAFLQKPCHPQEALKRIRDILVA